MATDFFQRQSAARRSTKWLVGMFALAVLGIVAMTFIATMLAMGATEQYQQTWQEAIPEELREESGKLAYVLDNGRWGIPALAALGSLAIILLGCLYKITELRGGGTVVAETVGGRRVLTNTTDLVERRLLNVVEEMAIASGVPVPPVYMLSEEQGINAFAAGYSSSDAVVAVTRGTAEQLTRDQLQGVIAHEFSHILNGDMRLNIRLIGVLHGILLLGLLGRVLFQVAGSGSRRNSKDNSGALFFLVGLALVLLGLVGSVMGNLIKAAVSRQREYLADASAVQFTRNPGGIGGALKRIGAAVLGSRIGHRNAAEMSHMYFAQGVWQGFSGLMATHPALPKRILRIEPNWDGKFPEVPAVPAAVMELGATMAGFAGDSVPLAVVDQATDHIGRPTENHRQYAARLMRDLPKPILEAVHEPYGARAVIFALLLDDQQAIRTLQMSALATIAKPDVVELTAKLAPLVDQLDARFRLPLIDLSLPALRSMAKPQYRDFSKAFQELVKADNRLALFEWTLHRVLLRHLRPQFEKVEPPRISFYGLQYLGEPCSVLLSTLAHTGHTPEDAYVAIQAATPQLPKVDIQFLPPEQCGLGQLDKALNRLTKVSAKHRGRLVDACAAVICADKEVKIREAELLRGISDMLDCPMPPLLPGQPV